MIRRSVDPRPALKELNRNPSSNKDIFVAFQKKGIIPFLILQDNKLDSLLYSLLPYYIENTDCTWQSLFSDLHKNNKQLALIKEKYLQNLDPSIDLSDPNILIESLLKSNLLNERNIWQIQKFGEKFICVKLFHVEKTCPENDIYLYFDQGIFYSFVSHHERFNEVDLYAQDIILMFQDKLQYHIVQGYCSELIKHIPLDKIKEKIKSCTEQIIECVSVGEIAEKIFSDSNNFYIHELKNIESELTNSDFILFELKELIIKSLSETCFDIINSSTVKIQHEYASQSTIHAKYLQEIEKTHGIEVFKNPADLTILEVECGDATLCDVISSEKFKKLFDGTKEIRIRATGLLGLNCGVNRPGINLVLDSSDSIVVSQPITINLSGIPAIQHSSTQARSGTQIRMANNTSESESDVKGERGEKGLDGHAGQSSGNISIKGNLINAHLLTIELNGGPGGNGQSGGNGEQGAKGNDGKDAEAEDRRSMFQLIPSAYIVQHPEKEGKIGGKGGDGGRGGFGGEGGHAGKIIINDETNLDKIAAYGITIRNKKGAAGNKGNDGKGANGGLGGHLGCDYACHYISKHIFKQDFGEFTIVPQYHWFIKGSTYNRSKTKDRVHEQRASNGSKGLDGQLLESCIREERATSNEFRTVKSPVAQTSIQQKLNDSKQRLWELSQQLNTHEELSHEIKMLSEEGLLKLKAKQETQQQNTVSKLISSPKINKKSKELSVYYPKNEDKQSFFSNRTLDKYKSKINHKTLLELERFFVILLDLVEAHSELFERFNLIDEYKNHITTLYGNDKDQWEYDCETKLLEPNLRFSIKLYDKEDLEESDLVQIRKNNLDIRKDEIKLIETLTSVKFKHPDIVKEAIDLIVEQNFINVAKAALHVCKKNGISLDSEDQAGLIANLKMVYIQIVVDIEKQKSSDDHIKHINILKIFTDELIKQFEEDISRYKKQYLAQAESKKGEIYSHVYDLFIGDNLKSLVEKIYKKIGITVRLILQPKQKRVSKISGIEFYSKFDEYLADIDFHDPDELEEKSFTEALENKLLENLYEKIGVNLFTLKEYIYELDIKKETLRANILSHIENIYNDKFNIDNFLVDMNTAKGETAGNKIKVDLIDRTINTVINFLYLKRIISDALNDAKSEQDWRYIITIVKLIIEKFDFNISRIDDNLVLAGQLFLASFQSQSLEIACRFFQNYLPENWLCYLNHAELLTQSLILFNSYQIKNNKLDELPQDLQILFETLKPNIALMKILQNKLQKENQLIVQHSKLTINELKQILLDIQTIKIGDDSITHELENLPVTQWHFYFQKAPQHHITKNELSNDSKRLSLDELMSELKLELKSKNNHVLGKETLKKDIQLIVKDYKKAKAFWLQPEKLIKELNRDDIKKWLHHYSIEKKKDPNWLYQDNHMHQLIAVIMRGIQIVVGKEEFRVRKTQLIALWLYLDAVKSQQGRLGQVATGEGKTLILAMFAIIQGLQGKKVNIITSSPNLAIRDSNNNTVLYKLFGLTVANNCDDICQENLEERSKRYQHTVVYGDVGSFQRDILLSKFYGKNIIGNRNEDGTGNEEIIFIDEVDNPLQDKANNTLYLSHEIPDLRHLLQIYLEIWYAVHFAQWDQNTPDNVNSIIEYIKIKLKKREIATPAYLESFIRYRLKTWIEMAYLAKEMSVNNQFILSKIKTKNIKDEITIMDNDTGVEQKDTQWNQGLHQFVQLATGRKFRKESLKAVYLSNLSYFRSYEWKIYGITGTLGNDSDKTLLSKMYQVDFFELPRFKPRLFVEEEAIIAKDESAWIEQICADVKLKIDKQRSVLIICHDKEKAKLLKKSIQGKFSKESIIKYNNADKIKHIGTREQPLQTGKVIIATNLAGRGADLIINELMIKHGGLHVILSYMTDNSKIELQDFGRAGRNGEPGTGRYIICHPEIQDIAILRQIRDQKALEVVEDFRVRGLQAIEMERILFDLFNQTYQKIKRKLNQKYLSKYGVGFIDIQLNCLNTRWAFWLDQQNDLIQSVTLIIKDQLLKEFQQFSNEMLTIVRKNNLCVLAQYPHDLTQLGKYFLERQNYDEALKYLNKVIDDYPDYAEIAYMFKARVIGSSKKQDAQNRKEIKHALNEARSLIHVRIVSTATTKQLLPKVMEICRNKGIGQCHNSFEEQMQNEINLYSKHLSGIQAILGHEFDESIFDDIIVDPEMRKKFTTAAINNKSLVQKFHFSKFVKVVQVDNQIKIILEKEKSLTEFYLPVPLSFCRDQIISSLANKIKLAKSKPDQEHDLLKIDDFKDIILSSQSLWQLLCNEKLLTILSESFYKINLDQDSLKDIVFGFKDAAKEQNIKSILEQNNHHNFVYSMVCSLITSNEFHNLVEVLSQSGLLIEVPQGELNLHYSSVDNSFILPEKLSPFQDIFKLLFKNDIAQLNKMPRCTDVKLTRVINFSELILPDTDANALNLLINYLKDQKIVKPSKIKFSLANIDKKNYVENRLNEIKAEIDKSLNEAFSDQKHFIDMYKNRVNELIFACLGKLKTISEFSISAEHLQNFFSSGVIPPEINQFIEIMFDDVLVLEKARSLWDWNAFAVAMLGLVQIAIGVALEIYTVGAGTIIAAGLISEGISDLIFAAETGLSGTFSWKAYGVHKLISVCITTVSLGIGAFCTHFFNAGLTIGLNASGSSALEILAYAGKRVGIAAAQAVGWKVAGFALEKFMGQLPHELKLQFGVLIENKIINSDQMKESTIQLETTMKSLFTVFDEEEAKLIIKQTFSEVYENSQGNTFSNRLQSVAFSIVQEVPSQMLLFSSLEFAPVLAAFVALIIGGIEHTVKFIQLKNLIPNALNELERKLKEKLSNRIKINVDVSNNKLTVEQEQSIRQTINQAKEHLTKTMLDRINSEIVTPAFTKAVQKTASAISGVVSKANAKTNRELEEQAKKLQVLRQARAQRQNILDADDVSDTSVRAIPGVGQNPILNEGTKEGPASSNLSDKIAYISKQITQPDTLKPAPIPVATESDVNVAQQSPQTDSKTIVVNDDTLNKKIVTKDIKLAPGVAALLDKPLRPAPMSRTPGVLAKDNHVVSGGDDASLIGKKLNEMRHERLKQPFSMQHGTHGQRIPIRVNRARMQQIHQQNHVASGVQHSLVFAKEAVLAIYEQQLDEYKKLRMKCFSQQFRNMCSKQKKLSDQMLVIFKISLENLLKHILLKRNSYLLKKKLQDKNAEIDPNKFDEEKIDQEIQQLLYAHNKEVTTYEINQKIIDYLKTFYSDDFTDIASALNKLRNALFEWENLKKLNRRLIMLKRIEDFGNGAVATVEKVGELQTKLTGVLGKLGFQQESSEARLLRDEFIDQNAYMVMTGANMLFKLFMEKEKTSQSLFKAIERVADKMTNISADMIKIATALLENLNKQQQQLTATLDAEIFQALAAKRDLTTKIAIVGDRKWETQKQKNEGKISEENYKATMELLDKEVAALKEAFESEEKSRDKIIKLIEEQQKIMHTAIESYNKNHAATRELVQSIVTQQKETMREIAQLFSDISKDNNSLLKEIIQIGASYVKSEQEHKHALEMAKNGVKPSELPAAKSAPQLPGPNGNGSAAPNGNHMSSGDNNADFDALDKVYRSGKSNYRQLCAEAKKGANADQVRLSSFFESADTLFGQSYSKYKKLDKNKLNESEKRKVEKRIGKLKDPDGKYSPTKLLAGKSP